LYLDFDWLRALFALNLSLEVSMAIKKPKYIFSKETQRFEPHQVPMRRKVLHIVGIISGIIVSAAIIVALAFRFLGSPKEREMREELWTLQEKYSLLRKDLKRIDRNLNQLQERDNDIYRVIFEAEPLPNEIRNGRVDERDLEKRLEPFGNVELLDAMEDKLEQLEQRLSLQHTSFDSIAQMINNKEEMLQSIPSIQPVSNKQLKRIASGFGYRIDPIYKIGKFHAGLDFSAPQGTPIYATGQGTVEISRYSSGGYGNEIWIKHGYGYRTHYAHMIKRKASEGQKVKRGQVIGYVGSTGKSTGPHLHYEVERKGTKVDPIHFFFNDLATSDYERMVKLSQASNQSFD
jgi:murein DD-endopeptidase MepM/ murein hydrolase activator NlpD